MKVYKANLNDINDIVNIYNLAVDHMYNENNTNQWQKNNDKFIPSITKYIEEKQSFSYPDWFDIKDINIQQGDGDVFV